MTATLTEHVTKEPNPALRRPIVAADFGNRTTQWLDPKNRVRTIPSVIKKLESWEEAEPCEESVLVETFDNDGIVTERFILGAEAQIQKGVPAFEQNKCELAKQLLYAALEPMPGQNTVIIDCLRIALPDARNDENVELLKQLEGVHEFMRNFERIYASVRRVEPVDETRPAYKYARENGLFKSTKNVNGILDLGGGTALGRLYSPSGSLNRQADVNVPGTFALAQKINAALLPATGQSQDLSLIMDAIADGSYVIGTSGISFANIFEKCRDSWLEEIRGKLRTAWGSYFCDIGEVLIIGGSAPLAKPIEESTKGRFRIAPSPQTISIKGMVL